MDPLCISQSGVKTTVLFPEPACHLALIQTCFLEESLFTAEDICSISSIYLALSKASYETSPPWRICFQDRNLKAITAEKTYPKPASTVQTSGVRKPSQRRDKRCDTCSGVALVRPSSATCSLKVCGRADLPMLSRWKLELLGGSFDKWT